MATTVEGTALTEAHRQAQVGISTQLVADLHAIWPLLDVSALDSSFPGYARAAEVVIADRRAQSARLSAAYVSAFRDAEGPGPISVPALAQLATDQAMTSLLVTGPVAIKIAMRGGSTPQRAAETAFVQTTGSAIRLVQNGGRATILGAVRSDQEADGYGRTTDGHPCHFCALLATRTNYRSEATAAFKAHDGCHCHPEPIYGSDYSLPSPQAREWERLYRDSTSGLSGADARAAFRRAYDARS